ncbi:MAG: Scr1 family TA system antitoxin-like transcriptional regulator [Streptomyces sp.]
MERQERLRAHQTRIWALTSAATLRTRVGGAEVMVGQMQSLGRAADRPEVPLRVHPLDGPAHAMTGRTPLTVYRFEVPEISDHVVREGGLPGTADVCDAHETVTAHLMLFDHSCTAAPHPHKS